MTAMFPDSGVPAADAKNTILDPYTVNCDELWYSTNRCQPRFDPAAANAMLSELINAVNCAGLPYDCTKFDNLCRAIESMIQHGDSNCAPLTGGPNNYYGALHPPLTAYPTNCCMMLKVIPNVNNAGAVSINIDNLGWIPVLRSNGTQLAANDWIAGIPQLLIYCNGQFLSTGMFPSQVPTGPLDHQVDLWVNNAYGNDGNDGLSDSPGHALATFQRAINLAFSYSPGPYPVVIHIMAGTYAGGYTPMYPGPSLTIVGTGSGTMIDGGGGQSFSVAGPNNANISNVAVNNSAPLGSGGTLIALSGASLSVDLIYAHNCNGGVIQAHGASVSVGRVYFYAHAYCLFWSNYGGNMGFGPGFTNCTIMAAFAVDLCCAFAAGVGSMGVGGGTPGFGGGGSMSGSKYLCALNGVVDDQTGSVWFAGTGMGSTSSGGQYVIGG